MGERMVIVIEYEADTAGEQAIVEAVTQLRTWIDDHEQPHIRPVQFAVAIKDDADQVLAVFEP
jgi:hypothetical protein